MQSIKKIKNSEAMKKDAAFQNRLIYKRCDIKISRQEMAVMTVSVYNIALSLNL